VRYGRDALDEWITFIFGEEEKNNDGSEKQITFGEYVDKMNKRALKEQTDKMLSNLKRKKENEEDDR
jgi:hypothetical protein